MTDRSERVRVVETGGGPWIAGQELQLNLECELRHLPGRRRVWAAQCDDGSGAAMRVLWKSDIHPDKGLRDARREWSWVRRLDSAGLVVPAPLALVRSGAGGWGVLTAWVENARELGTALGEATGEATVRARLARLVTTVQATHEAGFWQTDLHLGNYLLDGEEKLWIIDAASHRSARRSAGVSRRERVENWALLRANLPRGLWTIFDEILGETSGAPALDQVRHRSLPVLEKRLRRYRKKSQRTCSAFLCEDGPGWRGMRGRSVDAAWVQELRSMSLDQAAARYQVLKRASRCLVVEGRTGDIAWVLKLHWYGRGRPAALSCSRARRSWVSGHGLRLMGIHTPEPLAMWEHGGGGRLLGDALLMVKDDGQPLQRWVRAEPAEEVRKRVAAEAEAFFAQLEEVRASHGDAKASNFHVGPEGDLRVIDLDSFQWGGLRWRRRVAQDRERFRRNAVKFPEGRDIFHLGSR